LPVPLVELDVVISRLLAGPPVQDEPAELTRRAEVQRERRDTIAGEALPPRARQRIDRERGLVPALERAGGRDDRPGRARARQRHQRQLVEPRRALATGTGRDRELDGGDVVQLPATLRAPGERDLALAHALGGPFARILVVHPVAPPHVLAGVVDELQFQVLRRRLATELEFESVILGQVQVELPVQHGIATAAVEVEVHPQGVAMGSRLGSELHRRAAGGDRGPGARRLERCEDDGRRGWGRQCRRRERGDDQRPAPVIHPFTLPAITPRMYQRWSTMNTSSTGSTVTTAPAIISSVSCTCSPTRLASATGSV